MIWTHESKRYCPNERAGNPPFVEWMGKRLKGGLLVDCGANVGAVCVATLLASPGSRAVAFEPQTRAADVLVGLAAANKVDVTLIRKAVGGAPGQAVLKFPVEPSISGWGSIAPHPDFTEATNKPVTHKEEPCEVITLDDWWTEAGKPEVRVVKIDCQGAEVDILEGGREMFATVPYLFIEEHGPTLAEHGHTIAEMREKLKELGYEWERTNRNNLRCWKKGT